MGLLTTCRPLKVTTPDGVGVSVQVWGNGAGPEIVFIHGMLQSHLSWSKQIESPLARKFRLVTYDFRGHGGSDKPFDANLYNDSVKFAEELKAVMDAVGLRRPILVGWSFGARIIADYLLKYGSASLAGINFIAPAISPNPAQFGPRHQEARRGQRRGFCDEHPWHQRIPSSVLLEGARKGRIRNNACLQRQRALGNSGMVWPAGKRHGIVATSASLPRAACARLSRPRRPGDSTGVEPLVENNNSCSKTVLPSRERTRALLRGLRKVQS